MSREIKFRAWGINVNGEGEARMYMMDDIRDTDYSRRELTQLEDDDINELNPWMQFTGLQDKNGTDIYEGDVVHIGDDDGFNEVVAWKQLDLYDREVAEGRSIYRGSGIGFFLSGMTPWSVEVIGNIYEHPELLERGV